MTGRQKRYWQILATFLLGGAVAGVAYNVVRGHLAPINFATGAIFGLMIASGIGAFEALVSQGPARLWLRSLPLAGAVAVRSLVYAAVIFPIQYYDLGVKVMGLQPITTPKEFWSATLYSIGVAVVFSFLLEISYLIGPRRFIRLIAGLYHAPREEERFVLFVDVAGSTGTAERLGDRRSHTMLDRVFSIATGPVLDFGGEIDQYVGDEMIVTWPAASGVGRWSRSALFPGNAGGPRQRLRQLRARVRTRAPGARQLALWRRCGRRDRRHQARHRLPWGRDEHGGEIGRSQPARFRRICRVTVRPRETGSRRKDGPRKFGNVQPARET